MNDQQFIQRFLAFVDNEGIFDEYDRDSNKMVTSKSVQKLIDEARASLPEPLKPKEAALRMRELSPEHRNRLIAEADQQKVIDLRGEFARRMADNGAARGTLESLINAMEDENYEEVSRLLDDAKGIIKGPENVFDY